MDSWAKCIYHGSWNISKLKSYGWQDKFHYWTHGFLNWHLQHQSEVSVLVTTFKSPSDIPGQVSVLNSIHFGQAAYTSCGSAPAFLTQAQRAPSLFHAYRGKQLPALPAAIHQHNKALPYGGIAHCELNLSQRHFCPAVRQVHSKSFKHRYLIDHMHKPYSMKQHTSSTSWWCIFN